MTQSLHLVYIHETLDLGGTEILRWTTLRHMRQQAGLPQRLRWTVVCLRGKGRIGEQMTTEGIRVVEMGWRKSLPSVRLMLRLRARLRDLRPDIVHTCLFEAHRHGIPAARLAGCRCILMEEHGMNEWMGHRERLYARLLARMAAKVVTVSHAQAAHLAACVPYPETRMVVLPNCIDPERLGGRPDFAPVRNHATALTAMGGLREVKEFPLLLHAFRRVAAQKPDCRLTIAGEGDERPNLEHLIAELGLRGRVNLPGRCRDVHALLSATDVYVHPCSREAFCLSLVEAMYAGCACVAPRTKVIEEVSAGGRLARLVPPGDADAMAAAILELLDDPDLRRRMGKAAAAHVTSHYLPRPHIARLLELYQSLNVAGMEGWE